MTKLLLILSFTLGLATLANADNRSIFRGEFEEKPSYSDCVKAIQKGVVITTNQEGGYRTFFYKDKLYTIIGRGTTLICKASTKLK